MTAVTFTLAEWRARLAHPLKNDAYHHTKLGPYVLEYKAWCELANKAERTIQTYEEDLARLALAVNEEPAAVGVGDLTLALSMFPPGSYARATSSFKGFFRWLRTREIIDRNPCDLLPVQKAPKPKVYDIFTAGEQAALIAAAKNTPLGVVDRLRCLLMLDVGLRNAEARLLQVKDINLADKYVVVRRGKGGKARLIPVAGDLVRAAEEFLLTDIPRTRVGRDAHRRCEYMDRQPRPDDYVWFAWKLGPTQHWTGAPSQTVLRTTPDQQLVSSDSLRKWWLNLCAAAGVTYRKPHMARHTFATNLLDADANMYDVKDLLGHASIATTERYIHSSRKRLVGAIELLNQERGER